ncbi:hypothetical protein JCM6882_007380 [Rhodosporidiobolus microsporus]
MNNPAVTNLMVSLGAMQVARKIDFNDPDVLFYVRCLYVGTQLLSLGVYYWVSLKIKQKNDLKVLKYTEPAKPMSQDGPTQVTTTNRDYDLSETSKAIRSVLMGCLFMCFMHLYMKYTQPLFIQGIMPLKSMFDSKILKIHLFGKSATGDLKRPFAAAPSMFNPSGAAQTEEPVKEEPAKKVEAKKTK